MRAVLLTCATVLLSMQTLLSEEISVRENIDWAAFLARHDLVWNRLPKTWEESAFIGNGLLGATIYAGSNDALQWDVNRTDLEDRAARIAVGRFKLLPQTEITSGKMRLDLWNAEAQGTFESASGAIEWKSFTHADEPVTVIEWAGAPGRVEFEHLPAIPTRPEYRKEEIPEKHRNPQPEFGSTGNVHWCLQRFTAGGGYVVAWMQKELGQNRNAVYLTIDYSAKSLTAERAVATLQQASSSEYRKFAGSHRSWWHAFYPKSFLSIPDTRLESFYWIQMYKLASATREDRPALDLMGPWFRRTPWPAIWWNLNIQLTYWPVYPANHLELGQSLIRLLKQNQENLVRNAPEQWRSDSAGIGRSTGHDCIEAVKDGENVGERGNLVWTLHNCWLHYRYSGDEGLLRQFIYPLLKRAANYYLHLLTEGPDGKLHIPIAISPEFPKNAPDTNYDHALLRWGLQTLLAVNERFTLNDPQADQWLTTLEKLAPYPVDETTGYMIGAGQPFDESHRHFSHLLMIYPLQLVDSRKAADRPLIEKSLAHWQSLPSKFKGYSYTGASAMYAWLGNGNRALSLLEDFLDKFPKPNTLYTEAGPVIETPLSAAASLQEMLLQSWSMEPFETDLRIFPAIPSEWKDVSFHRLLAQGAFEVSASMRGGKREFVLIRSLAGSPCRVCSGLDEPIVASGSRKFHCNTVTDANGHRITSIDLQKGETVTLTSGSTNELLLEPVVPEPGRTNYYGLSAKAEAK